MRDLTNQVTWIALLPEVASIESGGISGQVGGLATAQGYTGFSPIYAEATNPDGTIVLSNAQTFTCNDPATNVCAIRASPIPSLQDDHGLPRRRQHDNLVDYRAIGHGNSQPDSLWTGLVQRFGLHRHV